MVGVFRVDVDILAAIGGLAEVAIGAQGGTLGYEMAGMVGDEY